MNFTKRIDLLSPFDELFEGGFTKQELRNSIKVGKRKCFYVLYKIRQNQIKLRISTNLESGKMDDNEHGIEKAPQVKKLAYEKKQPLNIASNVSSDIGILSIFDSNALP